MIYIDKDKKQLIERKYQLKNIFRGQIYQLWAQYFCMIEMRFEVDYIGFYEISTNKNIKIELPSTLDRKELLNFIEKFRAYSPLEDNITVNTNKCQHCIYCNCLYTFSSSRANLHIYNDLGGDLMCRLMERGRKILKNKLDFMSNFKGIFVSLQHIRVYKD